MAKFALQFTSIKPGAYLDDSTFWQDLVRYTWPEVLANYRCPKFPKASRGKWPLQAKIRKGDRNSAVRNLPGQAFSSLSNGE